jgi:general nucleoside transport system permease protein
MTHGSSGIQTLFIVGVALSIPVVWAALGELIAEQSGVINIGVEGVMLIAALTTALVHQHISNFIITILAGAGTGLILGIILGYFYVYRAMNQIVTGILFNVFALGFTAAVYNQVVTLASSLGKELPSVKIPLLGSIPAIGPVLFDQSAMAYIAVGAMLLVAFLLRRSWFGLYARAAGQRPSAVESAGQNVLRLRFIAEIFGCTFAGVGGAVLILTSSGGFNLNITAGSGYIALAVLVVARWNPFFAVLTCLGFGIAQAFQFQVNQLGVLGHFPSEFWQAVPYLVTILALCVAKGSRYPPACGVPYIPPKSAASGAMGWLRSRRLIPAPTTLPAEPQPAGASIRQDSDG